MSVKRNAPMTEEEIGYIIAHFKNTENKELARQVGCSVSTINKIQYRYRLTKSKEHLHRVFQRCGKMGYATTGIPPISEEDIRRRADSFKRRYREEKARWMFGLPQKTKIRLRKEPKKKQAQRTYLRSLGYIIDGVNNIAYYTDETKRAVRMEAYTSKKKKCYYKFLSYEEHQ